MRLYIAEKPSVAKTIATALGLKKQEHGYYLLQNGDAVTNAIGHLVGLAEPKTYNPEWASWDFAYLPMIPTEYKLSANPSTKSQLDTIKKIVATLKPTEIVNACDAGREGELIFRWIIKALKIKTPTRRLWLTSMITSAIQNANQLIIQNKEPKQGAQLEREGQAAEARAQADWLVGINGTRATTKTITLPADLMEDADLLNSLKKPSKTPKKSTKKPVNTSWSIGRVQTPTLAIIVDREIRIKDFNSKPFYNIQATFATPNKTGGTYQGTWTNPDFKSDPTAPEKKADRVSTISEAKIIQDRIKNHNSKIKDEEKVIKENPPSLYNLNEIQRDANKLYSWSAKKTLDIAQQLYERHKIISYPRTESTSLPEDYVAEVTKIFKEITPHPLGHYVKLAHDPATAPNKKQIFNDKEISDHFAIIPTGETPGQLDADETKLYGLVVRRFVAAFCSPAEKKQIQRQTIIDNNEKDLFVCKSTLLSVAGWRAAYDEKAGKFTPVELPGHTNDPAVITDLKLHEGNTQPPNRYTESDILGIMENIANLIEDPALKAVTKKRGLGTSATRGDTIDKLKRVGYINIQGKSLVPTPKAVHLIISLRQLGLDSITNPAMTGDWEVNLQEVEKGQRSYATFMTTIEDYTKDFIEKLRVEANKNPASSSNRGPASEYSHNCPHCDSPLKSYDSHIACSKFNWKDPKACHFKIQKTLLGREMKEDEIETLITTHKTELLLGFISKTGRPFNAALSIDKKDGNIKFNYN